MSLDWPAGFERTPPEERESTSKFDVGYRRTKKEIRQELERLGVDEWRLDDETGSGGDPGVVVRWQKDGEEHAVACDRYTSKKQNGREVLSWLRDTRLAGDRPVETGSDDFAAARLPPGDPEREKVVVGRQSPHEVLGVSPNADDDAIRAAGRRLLRKHHPDTGEQPDEERFKEVKRSYEAIVR